VKERIFNGCVVDYYAVERRVVGYVKGLVGEISKLQQYLYVMEHKKKNNNNSNNNNVSINSSNNNNNSNNISLV
jgi:hypothetical protein